MKQTRIESPQALFDLCRNHVEHLLGSCASYGPYHANTAAEPTKSVRDPQTTLKNGLRRVRRSGLTLDNSQRKVALKPSMKQSVHCSSFTFTVAKTTPSSDVCVRAFLSTQSPVFPNSRTKNHCHRRYIACGQRPDFAGTKFSHVLEPQIRWRRDRGSEQLPGLH